MNITIASGKGGTGKTTFAVNLAYALAENGEQVRLLDCDVEEPNDHLFVQPHFSNRLPVEVMKPIWEAARCTSCGDCAQACTYNAIAVVKDKVLIFNELCHSCGLCSYVCPENALREQPTPIGNVELAPKNEPFFFAHGILNIAEALAPNVVRAVKTHCREDAINIIDASPGTSCPVVEAVSDADVVVLLTEPTPFGLNDLKLAVGLALKSKTPTGIVINRSDGEDHIIAEYADEVDIPIIGRVPFKRRYAEAYSKGLILTHEFPEFARSMLDIYEQVAALRRTPPPPAPDQEKFALAHGELEPFQPGQAENYKEINIISGKGGSGKTTVVSSLAMLAKNHVMADNDVDAADLHLLIEPQVREAHPFYGGQKAVIDTQKCTGCGLCLEACHFDAIRLNDEKNSRGQPTCRIDDLACEGCGLCGYVCSFDAVSITPSQVGWWYISDTAQGPMVHARLGIAEENSGRLVTHVRNVAADLATDLKKELILGDGPPGTGCPVIASVSGVDRVLIVTEPTVSGVHDMQRVLDLTRHFGIQTFIIINKADLNQDQAARIAGIADDMAAPVLAEIPFDHHVHDALMIGKTVVEYGQGPAFEAIMKLWEKLQNLM